MSTAQVARWTQECRDSLFRPAVKTLVAIDQASIFERERYPAVPVESST
jgi:hypothetical protein